MRGVGPGPFIENHRLLMHALVPAALSLVLMGLYFSGIPALRAIVAPSIEGLHPFSWREFGLLEMLQNGLLILIVFLLAEAARSARPGLRLALLGLAGLFVFTLLEEIDYGAHYVELVTGELGSLSPEGWDRNLHNRVNEQGVQYGRYMRLGATAVVALGGVVAPLLFHRARPPWLRLWLPSRWMILTIGLMLVLSWLAHALDDAGLATIDGVPGNLEKNISEFRELNLYYIFALYFAVLHGRLREQPGGS